MSRVRWHLVPPSARLFSAAFVAGVAVAAIAALLLDRCDLRRLPPCPFRSATGILCPGCGSLRAIHSLVRLDIPQAWAFNPLLVLVAPYLALWVAHHAGRALAGRQLARPPAPAWFGAILLLLVVSFFLARNLPLEACRALTPHELERPAR